MQNKSGLMGTAYFLLIKLFITNKKNRSRVKYIIN